MKVGAIKKVASAMRLGTGHQNKDWVQYPCPFARWKHASGKDSNPSFGIRVKPNAPSHYWCFTCHKSGPLSYLPLALADHTGKYEEGQKMMLAILEAEAEEGFGDFEEGGVIEENPEPLDERAYGNIFPHVWEDRRALRYVSNRGIRRAGAEALDMRWDPEDQRIVFPVRDRQGLLYGFTGRTILPPERWPHKHYRKSKDYAGLPKQHMLLNAHNVTDDCNVVVVEGPVDVAVAATILAGTNYVPVGLLGSALLAPKFQMLCEWGRPTFLMLDNDKAGTDGIFGSDNKPGAADMLFPEIPVYIPDYPDREGAEDPGTLTAEELIAALEQCERWPG